MGDTTSIRRATSVDAAWLTEILHASGVADSRRIVAFEATSIGTGQVGENVRYELTWDETGGPDDVPGSVVGKFPSTSEVSRAAAVQVDTYRREVGFYRDLRAFVDINTPQIHHVGWDPATHDFVLIMDDVRSASQGDQLAGCDVDTARSVIAEAVGLHAPTWGSAERFGHLDWLSVPDDDRTAVLAMFYVATLPGFVDRYRGVLDGAVLAVAERVVERFGALAGEIARWSAAAGGWCVVHADYRLDNLLLSSAPDTAPVTVVDWQTTSFGAGPSDVAYFLGSGLVPGVREQAEGDLVADYAAALRSRGVEIADDLVWDGYVLGAAGGLLMAILASQIVEQTERGDAMFVVMAERHAAQIEHLGLLDRL
jgi:Phosphotransferase enzyme family